MKTCYKLVPTSRFIKKLDKFTQKQITNYLSSHVTDNPRQYGKALTANRSGQWRYRIGNYRVIVSIEDDKLIVTALEVGHRKEVYK
ncbi:TPA: type II toxin-antitoxin system RelE/ParE family toxin [Streptococcus suis]|nr:type II toxin-antitoxin system RelE/ParE family toxin [Streptococcus suis]NQJ55592.1 type II toxin-antitoxin system RelE/ParE family toxin [Streptococcus suis]HEM4387725.1 type II toxin-antitoxin system RelE/ParE family toxin [Streptococcus suis]HEM4415365.1 type II toxin-antitoxin system RelE/ParE family toxin [Streptococcus suis]HEM4610372.1 type II toxin-antitoxin system RelE/ParE family toxin [Streptococcus suis]